jgi:hypothetical protein
MFVTEIPCWVPLMTGGWSSTCRPFLIAQHHNGQGASGKPDGRDMLILHQHTCPIWKLINEITNLISLLWYQFSVSDFSLLWQNTLQNNLKYERFVLAYSFKGFNPCLVGSIFFWYIIRQRVRIRYSPKYSPLVTYFLHLSLPPKGLKIS